MPQVVNDVAGVPAGCLKVSRWRPAPYRKTPDHLRLRSPASGGAKPRRRSVRRPWLALQDRDVGGGAPLHDAAETSARVAHVPAPLRWPEDRDVGLAVRVVVARHR